MRRGLAGPPDLAELAQGSEGPARPGRGTGSWPAGSPFARSDFLRKWNGRRESLFTCLLGFFLEAQVGSHPLAEDPASPLHALKRKVRWPALPPLRPVFPTSPGPACRPDHDDPPWHVTGTADRSWREIRENQRVRADRKEFG